jgi:ATP-dependent Clp protease ATP-binding subunit ClpX
MDYQDNNHDDNSTEKMRYCAICHRSEKDAGRLINMPGGMSVCPDCVQKMFDAAGQIDYQDLMNRLSSGQWPDFGGFGFPGIGSPASRSGHANESGSDGQGSAAAGNSSAAGDAPDAEKKISSAEEANGTGTTAPEKGAGRASSLPAGGEDTSELSSSADQSQQDGDEHGDGESGDKESGNDKKGPSISFLNLSDLLGGGLGGLGGGMRSKPVKKKKKDGPKPVFTADNIPAPHLLKAELDKYVIGQEHAKKVISVAAYNHYKRVKTGTMDDIEIEKSNILLIGPTGSGKTYLVKTLARLLDVPLAITDATNLTEAGYIGDDVESCISKLLEEADNDVDKAEKGIVFIDEIDKLAKKQNQNARDVSGEAVQQGLLKLLEGSEVEVPVGASSKNAMVPMVTVDTSNILFICGGAFPSLEGIIKERLTKTTSLGFSAELKDRYDNDPDILSKVTNDDLRAFGMIPEFLGRLPIVCTLSALDEDMMVRILKEPKNAILKQYQKLLALDGVDLEFDEGALHAIAKKALAKKTGARALRSIIEDFMLDIMYEIPKDKNIGKVTITEDYVNGHGGPLIEIKPELPAPSGEQPKLPGSSAAQNI